MKKLNIPFLLFLVVGSMVLVVGTHLLHGYQVSRSAQNLKARAEAAYESGDVDEQIRILQRYMRYRPDDIEQLKILLTASRDRTLSAKTVNVRELMTQYISLEKAIREHPEDVDLRRLGLEFALHRNVMRVTDAMDHLERIEASDALTSSDKVIYARCKEATSKTDEAINQLCEMIGFDRTTSTFRDVEETPEWNDADETTRERMIEDAREISAYVALLSILERQSSRAADLELANKLMDRMVELNPDSTDAYLRRAAFYQSKYEGVEGKQKSLADVNKALEINRNQEESSPSVILLAASTLMALGDLEAAQNLLDDGRSQHPDDRRMYAGLAELADRKGDKEESLRIVEEGLSRLKLNPELLYQRAGLELDVSRIDDCKATMKRLEEKKFDPPRMELLRAKLLMYEKNFQLAAKKLEALRPMMRQSPFMARQIDANLLTCYKRLGFTDKIAAIGERLGGQSSAMLDVARSLYAQGRYDQALATLNEVRQNGDTLTPAGMKYVFKLTMDINIAKEQGKPEKDRDWTTVDGMAEMWLSKQDYGPEGREEFEIDMLRKKGQLAEARSRAEAAVRRFPGHAGFWMLLNALTLDNEQGMRILDQIEERFGDTWTLRVARSNRIVLANSDDAVAQLAQLLENIDQFSLRDQAALQSIIANSLARLGEYDKSIDIMRQMLKADDSNLAIRTSIFDAALKAGNITVMEEILEELAARSGRNSTEWQVAQANRLLWLYENDQKDKGVLRQVRDLVEKARDNRPDWAPIYELQADVLMKEGNPEAAALSLQTALEKRPRHVPTIKKLAAVYTAMGRVDDANLLMSQLPDAEKSRVDLINDLRAIAAKDPQAALARAQSLIPEDSTNGLDLVLLSDVQSLAGQDDAALETLKRAISVDPKVPQAWTRTVEFLMARNRKPEAEAIVRDLQLRVNDESLPLVLGQAQALLGDYAAAEATYQEGLKTKPQDDVLLRNLALIYQVSGNREKTLETLDRIAAAKTPSARWARRTKASLIAESMAYKDFLSALKLVEENADEEGNLQGADLQLWLQLCARRPEAVSRQRAADRLKEIREKRRLTNAERAILAHVYKSSGRWPEAKETMLSVLSEAPNNQVFVATFIQWLLDEGQLSDAAAWSRKLPPQSTDAVRFSSILLVRQNRASDAAKRLLEISNQAKGPAQASTVQNVAVMMEELGKDEPGFYKLAEKQWAKYVQLRPQESRRLVEFYTRVPEGQKLTQALDLCEREIAKAIKAKDPNLLKYYINVALRGLRTNKKHLPENSEHFNRVTKWFEAAKKHSMNDLQLSWIEIDFHDIRGDINKLDSMYRDFLTRSDASDLQKAIVRNNLAFQLAVSGRGQESLNVIGDAIDQLGPRADFLDTRALAYLSSGDHDNAIKDLETALSSGNETSAMHFHLALAYDAKGDSQKAAEALQRALDLGLTDKDLALAEAKLFERLQKQLKPFMPKEEPQL